MQLSQKETELLSDLREQEQLCIDKYEKHSACAVDGQLKNLFTQIAGIERSHLDTINKIGQGQVPATGGSPQPQPSFSAVYANNKTPDKKNDCFLCTDLLTTEKHASHLYDTCVFEFTDEGVRRALNHIQSEEQGHGKMIYDYMKTNSMY